MTREDTLTPAMIRRQLRAESVAWVKKNLGRYISLSDDVEPEIDNDVHRDPCDDPMVAWQTWKEGPL